ncbi:MAG: hypothetical protein AAFY34_01805 [Pseudomonadota bacterium]
MARTLLFSIALSALATACTTSPTANTEDVSSVRVSILSDDVSEFERALVTADQLVEAGNTPTAIDRLTQMLGSTDLTDAQRATLYFERGKLRQSADGYDVWGAITDYETLLDQYPSSPFTAEATEQIGLARGEATSLNGVLEQPETTRSQRFSALLRLGEHQDAIDLMLSSNLRPENEELIAMYQIGYLCDGEDQTGPAYDAIEPDGTTRELRFCDFGK